MHHNTCCLCGIQPQVKGRAQSLIKQDLWEITIHQAYPEAQLWYHLQDLYDGILSRRLLHLVKHLAAVTLSRYAELESTCLQYQLLLNITGIAGMLGSLHLKPELRGCPGWLSSTSAATAELLWAGGSGVSEHQGAAGATTPVSSRTASSPQITHSALQRHWEGSPSEPWVWVLSHSSAAEPTSGVSMCLASWGTRWELNQPPPCSDPALSLPPPAAHKNSCVDSLKLPGTCTHSLFLY